MCNIFCPNEEKKYKAALDRCTSELRTCNADKQENYIPKSDLGETCGKGTAFAAASQTCVVDCKEGKVFDEAAGECVLDCGDKTLHDGKCLTQDELLTDQLSQMFLTGSLLPKSESENQVCRQLSPAVCEKVPVCKNVTKDFIMSTNLIRKRNRRRVKPVECHGQGVVEMAQKLLDELNITNLENVPENVKDKTQQKIEEAMSMCPPQPWQEKRLFGEVCRQTFDAGHDVCDVSVCRHRLNLPCDKKSDKKRVKEILYQDWSIH